MLVLVFSQNKTVASKVIEMKIMNWNQQASQDIDM